ncbi:MAG: Lrp/AsnC family transcriptional regulator [Myxococcales bacterium]|nr:Lrp/AsnC family transcriptional regulator [Myxococcales bacterium]
MDAIDLQIVRSLQEDGKAALAKLGKVVGLSAPAVLERVRKLEQAGVIRGYTALVDARAMGLDVTSFIGVSLQAVSGVTRFEQDVLDMPEVLESHHVTGSYTLLLKVRTKNTATLENLIAKIRAAEGVTRTETLVVLSTGKESVVLPIPDEEPKTKPRRLRRV